MVLAHSLDSFALVVILRYAQNDRGWYVRLVECMRCILWFRYQRWVGLDYVPCFVRALLKS